MSPWLETIKVKPSERLTIGVELAYVFIRKWIINNSANREGEYLFHNRCAKFILMR